jgi:hypothetical protein
MALRLAAARKTLMWYTLSRLRERVARVSARPGEGPTAAEDPRHP